MYKCEILADSLSPQGDRLTTFKVTYPRIIHAELMTHRVFSRNAASSRAIPVKKMIESVRSNMFTPLAIQKAHKGMQGSDYFEGAELEQAKQLWIESAELTLKIAEKMEKFGITKQLVNRILEPYQYYQVLVTATEWENFFELRCPKYHTPVSGEGFYFRSKKDCIANHSNPENLSKLENMTDLEWLQINESQAEIHIQAIAESMWDSYNESTPKQLKAGEWHIPFSDNINDDEILQKIAKKEEVSHLETAYDIYQYYAIKIATARCARISYETLGGNPKIDYEADIKLHDQLIGPPFHASPFEHCARAMNSDEYNTFIKGILSLSEVGTDIAYYEKDRDQKDNLGWCNNFKGFISYRYLIENK